MQCFQAPILNMLVKILTPFNFLFGQWKKLLSLLFKSSDDTGITEEELLFIVDEAEQDGGIDEQESKLIHSALEFTEQEVIDVLTPRIDITGLFRHRPLRKRLQKYLQKQHIQGFRYMMNLWITL